MGASSRLCLRCARLVAGHVFPKRHWSSQASSAPPLAATATQPELEQMSLSGSWLERTSIELSPEQVLKHEGQEALRQALSGISCGSDVYVSMVNSDFGHFDKVVQATGRVAEAGFRPIPHFPTARFESARSCSLTLERLRHAGAAGLLVVGGNDLLDRLRAGKCCYHSSGDLLKQQAKTLNQLEFESISLAGHPGSGFEVLDGKIDTCVDAGLHVTIASQFEFDTRLLLHWIHSLRLRFPGVKVAMGVPGITSRKRLQRISEICEVGSKDLPSLFEATRRNSAYGQVSLEDIVARFPEFKTMESAMGEITRASAKSGRDAIDRETFARVLAAAAELEVDVGSETRKEEKPSHPSGPSPFTSGQADAASDPLVPKSSSLADPGALAAPTDHMLAMAAYCERHQLAPGSFTAHLFPFGSLASTNRYLEDLKASFAEV